MTAEAEDGDELLRLAVQQLDDGADLVKLYLDGPDPESAPWTAGEVRRVVDATHECGATVTAHSGRLNGARVCAEAGVDCIEHGFELDEDCARLMVERGTARLDSRCSSRGRRSAGLTRIERFAGAEGARRSRSAGEQPRGSVRLAHGAGVLLGAGTDQGRLGAREPARLEVEALVEAGLEP